MCNLHVSECVCEWLNVASVIKQLRAVSGKVLYKYEFIYRLPYFSAGITRYIWLPVLSYCWLWLTSFNNLDNKGSYFTDVDCFQPLFVFVLLILSDVFCCSLIYIKFSSQSTKTSNMFRMFIVVTSSHKVHSVYRIWMMKPVSSFLSPQFNDSQTEVQQLQEQIKKMETGLQTLMEDLESNTLEADVCNLTLL